MAERKERLRAVLAVTVETREGGDYYYDKGDLLRHVIPWIEGTLDDRDDIADVTITEQPPVDRAALRDRIAEALYESCTTEAEAVERMTDAVLAVLPEATGPAAVLREAANRLSMDWGGPDHEDGMDEARKQLRRMAGEED